MPRRAVCLLLLAGCAGRTPSGGTAGADLEHCDRAFGTVTVEEDYRAPWYGVLGQYHLPSTVPLLQALARRSNCLVPLDAAAAPGAARAAADYALSPSIDVTQGGQGFGAVLGMVPMVGPVLGLVASGTHSSTASTHLLLTRARTGQRVADASGRAQDWNFGGVGSLFGVGGGGLGGYADTAEGKIIGAAFADSFNHMVIALRAQDN